MATTENFHNGTGSATEFQYTFPVLLDADVKASVNAGSGFVVTTAFTLLTSPTRVKFNTAPASGTNNVRIYRDTNVDSAKAVFAAGSSIRAADLNNNMDQVLYSNQEKDRPVATEDIKDDAVTGAKIASETITNDNIALNTITGNRIADDAISSGELAANSVGSSELKDNSVELSHMSANSVNSDQYVDGSIDTAHIANDAVNNDKIATGAVTSDSIGAGAVTGNGLQDLAVSSGKIADNAVLTSKINDAELKTLAGMQSGTASILASSTALTSTTTELNYVDGVTSAIQTQIDGKQPLDADLTELSSMQTGAAAKLKLLTADEVEKIDGLTSSTAELNKLDGVTASTADLNITASMTKQTTISDQDTSYPTSGAVVDYVAAQIAPIGGLEVIANDESFPETQPAAGVVISIADAGGLVVNGSGVSTTGDTISSDATVTINGINSSFHSTTIDPGIGMLVTSTGSGQIYDYHKTVIKESDVAQISDDINDFNSRYRIANGSGNLVGANDEGDLYFDTGTNKMYVYDGSSWGEVTSTGDFKYLVLTEVGNNTAANYDNSKVSFDLHENTTSGSLASITNAAQLMVSINGVIQKPNTGTNTSGLDGFVMTDGHTIKFTAGVPTSASVFVIQSGSALAVNVPADGTVTEAKLNANAPTNNYVLTADSSAGGGFKWAEGGSGTITWTLGNSGTDHWTFTGDGFASATNDPDILIVPGQTYKFVNGCASGTHAFNIKWYDASGGAGWTAYTTGMTNAGATGGNTMTWTVPFDVPQRLRYESGSNAGSMWSYIHTAAGTSTFGASKGYEVPSANADSHVGGFYLTSGTHSVGGSGPSGQFAHRVGDVGNPTIKGSGSNVLHFEEFQVATFDGMKVDFDGYDGGPGKIGLYPGSNKGTARVYIQGPTTYDETWTLELPAAAPTANGQALTSTTAGVATWANISSTVLDGCGYQNDQTISAGTYEIAANKGVHSVGPITVEGTLTVTGNWVVS